MFPHDAGSEPLKLLLLKSKTVNRAPKPGTLIFAIDKDGGNALHCAAMYDQPESILTLLRLGADCKKIDVKRQCVIGSSIRELPQYSPPKLTMYIKNLSPKSPTSFLSSFLVLLPSLCHYFRWKLAVDSRLKSVRQLER
ncbi:Hypothetical protein, putative [Bodo saltans]|uniref:Uncharacterized protein n=1 Tax=Bodo saltans TaxID=75058 RepID=A0A0S4IXH4_BODSA|nr:Hypothetical protein, putative [Bodo saltans]|eukprot:CUF57020.1 Hypothetical protein, putative [Bodo saltans]